MKENEKKAQKESQSDSQVENLVKSAGSLIRQGIKGVFFDGSKKSEDPPSQDKNKKQPTMRIHKSVA